MLGLRGFCLVCIAVGVQALDLAEPPKGDRLLFVNALWRHGDRAPESSFKGDLYPESFWDNGYGQLTNQGIQEHRDLGAWIRARYVDKYGFLPAEYDTKSFYIQSTYYNRTEQSALFNFEGMYGKEKGYKAPKVHFFSKNETDVIGLPYYGCHYCKRIAELALKTPEVKKYFADHKPLIQLLSSALNMSVPDIVWFYSLADPMIMEKLHGLKLAPVYEIFYDQMFELYVQAIRFMYGFDIRPYRGIDFRQELSRSIGGGILTEMVRLMRIKDRCAFNSRDKECEKNKQLKYRVFSMHDTTVLGLLSTFGFDKVDYNRDNNCQLASSIFVELWAKKDGGNYVKVIYRRNAQEIFDVTNDISGCGTNGCSLDQFEKRSQPYLLKPSFDEFCARKVIGDVKTGDF